MLFCSYIFILMFLPLSVAGYFLLNRCSRTAGRVWLLAASLFFYGYFNIYYLFLLIGSLVLNYTLGHILCTKRSKFLLALGIAANIFILGYCKYYDFFVSNINILFGTDILLKHLLLPLGISFFTFQQISYLYDVYDRVLTEKYSPLTYSLFVTFFPQLVAGPIVLANEMMPQFAEEKNLKVNYSNLACGIFIFSLGLAKKMLLADFLAPVADRTFAMSTPGFADSLVGSLAYFLQIYFDFSGYCDMAIGIGYMFNIVLPVNFYAPYRSANIQEFWKTWHITLGRFLTQFVYFPLGGSKKGRLRTYINLFMVFFVSGIWHGASWMYVIWGMVHGIAVMVHRFWSKDLKKTMPRYAGFILTFLFLWLSVIIFRSENLAVAKRVYCGFFRFRTNDFIAFAASFSRKDLLLFIVSFLIIFLLPPANSFQKNFKPALWHLAVSLILIVCSIFCFNKISPFIYFNF